MIVEMNITYILWPLTLISFNINLEQDNFQLYFYQVVSKGSTLHSTLKATHF